MKLIRSFMIFVSVLLVTNNVFAFQDKDDDLLPYAVNYNTNIRFNGVAPKVPEVPSNTSGGLSTTRSLPYSYAVKGDQIIPNNSSGLPDTTRGSYTVRGNQIILNNSSGLPDTTRGSYTVRGNQIVPNNTSGLPMGPFGR